MRKLTFSGFAKRYAQSLSLENTSSIYRLVKELENGNLRLRELLFLYAISNGRIGTLLSAARGTAFIDEYHLLASKYSYEGMLEALASEASGLPAEYYKVWASYLAVTAGKVERDARVKALIREKIARLKAEKSVSTYRICKALDLNNANVNAWLKNGTANKVSLDMARSILAYVEGA